MFSKYVWSLYIWKHSIKGVTKKVLIPQWNELRADINKVCLRFVHMKIQQKEEEQSGADIFFCSNASIALARSLCKYLLAVLITASEADAVAGFMDSWCHAVWCHSTGKPAETNPNKTTHSKKQKPNKSNQKTNQKQTTTKTQKQTKQWNESIMNYWWETQWPGSLCASYRAGPPLKQQKETTKNITEWADRCQAKKSQCRNPGSPQLGSRRSQCEAVQAWQAPTHIDHVDMPGVWKDGCETTVRHKEWKKQLHPPSSQSPLMCALAIIKISHRVNCALVQWGML